MHQQEVTGALAGGGRYRATSYMVEISAPDGSVWETLDVKDIREVRRQGQAVTIRRTKGKDVTLQGATLDDAGRLEAALGGPGSVMAEPVKRGGGILKVAGIGCGGFLALMVVIIVIAAAAAGSRSDKTKEASSGSSNSKQGADTHATMAVGSSATVKTAGDVTIQVTIEDILDPAVSQNRFEKPADGNRFVVFQLLVENVGKKETNGLDFQLRTAEGFEYQRKFVSGFASGELAELLNLTSGGKAKAVIAFEIPDGSSVQWLKIDPNPFAKGDLYFDRQ